MTKPQPFAFLVIGILSTFIASWFFWIWYSEWSFYDIQIPEGHTYEKPKLSFTDEVRDSLIKLSPVEARLEVIGSGFVGYQFYIWSYPKESGYLELRAYEITRERKLLLRKDEVRKYVKQGKTELVKFHTVVHEGSFEHYYPARFELWFEPDGGGSERKLDEVEYLIQGWDR
ncbi:MAG: hypothetical protein JJ975_05060 [Bacteroidia bacterium]|nr:hypothetical protein [Bacteroidia bacterium]